MKHARLLGIRGKNIFMLLLGLLSLVVRELGLVLLSTLLSF